MSNKSEPLSGASIAVAKNRSEVYLQGMSAPEMVGPPPAGTYIPVREVASEDHAFNTFVTVWRDYAIPTAAPAPVVLEPVAA